MSHVVKLKTELNNIELIKSALDILNLKYHENGEVRMWGAIKQPAQIVIELPKYDIGINQKSDGNCELICDYYAWNEIARHKSLSKFPKISDGEAFTGILKQAVNIVKSKIIAESQGDSIDISEPDSNGVIHAQIIQL